LCKAYVTNPSSALLEGWSLDSAPPWECNDHVWMGPPLGMNAFMLDNAEVMLVRTP
jgi:hypothetical protein